MRAKTSAKRPSKDASAAPESEPLAEAFTQALREAAANPADETRWERLEEAAGSGQPAQLIELYHRHLTRELPAPVLQLLSRRAVRFAADCFGETAREVADLLGRVLTADPDQEWAFEHLVATLTISERWSELLDAHDLRLSAVTDGHRRKRLLGEAAHIAKDLAGDQSRALGYLDQLFRLDPSDLQTASALERLFERQERWEDLVGIWKQRVPTLPPLQARDLQRRLAITLHEKLGRAKEALDQLRPLLSQEPPDPALPGLLERVLADQGAAPVARLDALDLLRQHLEGNGRGPEIPPLLKIALSFAEGDRLRALRRECGQRLQALGEVKGALEQYAALICLAPEDLDVEHQLRQLAEAAGDAACLARSLAAAGAACPVADRRIWLLTQAAQVHDRQLGDRAQAAALFEQALAEEAAPPELRLATLRRLETLFGELGDERKRVHALERLAGSEPGPAERRLAWAQAAERAEALGELDRALAAWEARLALDPADGEALAAMARLLGGAERWQALTELLQRRISSQPPPHQIRADLVQIATLARDRLEDLPRAIEVWREIATRFGEDAESVDALAGLYSATDRYADLAELLSRAALGERQRHASMLARLGDALRQRLSDPGGALDWYRRALETDPEQAVARAGLSALLRDPAWAAAAAEPLAQAAEKTDSWQLLVELLPHRLTGATQPGTRVRLLQQAATLAEERAGDPRRAFECLCQALPLCPWDLRLQADLLRLAESTEGFARAAQSLAEAIAGGAAPPAVLAQLHEQRAGLLERRLEDWAGARESYAAALTLSPQRLEVRQALLRTAARVGRWSEAAAALVDVNLSTDLRRDTLLPLYQSLAGEGEARASAAAALGQAITEATALDPTIRRDLHLAVARLLDCGGDPRGADEALGRALALFPGHVPTLTLRAELQRREPDRRLFETLSQLAAEVPQDLDFRRDAAELALGLLADEPLGMSALQHLWDQAVRLLWLGTPAAGKHPSQEAAVFALDQMVERHVASKAPERVRRATALLGEGARLPFPADIRGRWLRRAAELSEAPLADRTAALGLWRLLHEMAPADAEPRQALARLYEQEQRFGEALSVRVAELEGCEDPQRRLALRLDMVRLAGLLDQKVSPPAVLRANLAERPGHPESVRELTELLTRNGRPAELADVLEAQARVLAEQGDASASARLWAQVAELTEQALAQSNRAMAAWEQVAQLEPTTAALDALGRLALAAEDPRAASGWLDRRLSMTEGEPRAEVSVRLARAHLAAGQRHRAIACLDRALIELPRADELRAMLVELYREAEAWEPLARVLAEGCEYIADEAAWMDRARSAVELYGRLGLLGRAVPLLEKLLQLSPKDETFRSALAEGLDQSGRRDEARALLLELIEEAGWRRSRKRALLHHRLARVAWAQGDLPFALEHLEQASSMDISNRTMLQHLAEVAAASGADERAERAYRSLLVLKRQESTAAHAPESAGETSRLLAVTEILLRLHDLAQKRGQSDQAAELMESALNAGLGDQDEAQRLQQALLDRAAYDQLGRWFDKRLVHASGSPAAADIHAQMASALQAQGRPDLALQAQLLAVEAGPERADLVTVAAELARGQGKVAELVDRLDSLADRLRQRPDAPAAAALLLQAAQLADDDLGDLDRTLALCRRAEETQPRSPAVWEALARVAGKRGDPAEVNRLLALLEESAGQAATPQAAADVLYRVAGLALGRADTREAGIASLILALEKSPDIERAMALVAAVVLPQPDLVKILPLYERFARQSGDEKVLLDYLERRAQSSSVTVAEVREAVDLAVALGRPERIEPLLLRLAEIAALDAQGDKEATWALLELVQRRKTVGDLQGAAELLERASDRLESDRLLLLTRELSERAAQAGNLRLGAQLLERLRARTPSDETVWRPLLDRYIALRDAPGVDQLVSETLPLLVNPARRNELRLARARFLLDSDDGQSQAVEALRDTLMDEPRNSEALSLLAGCYQRIGAEEDLVDLLEQHLELAVEAGNVDSAAEIGLRLGEVLERSDRDRAVTVYERALRAAPGHRPLLRRLLASTPAQDITRERAGLMEELLAGDAGAEAGPLARDLADAWTKLGDEAAVRRVLEKGRALAPGDRELGDRLEQWYRAHQAWGPLAELLAFEGGRHADPVQAVGLLCEAATLRRERLSDPDGALALLAEARARAPQDRDLLAQLARARLAKGDAAGAVAEVQAALDGADLPADGRLPLLLLRAELDQARGDRRAAATALQQAHAIAPAATYDRLAGALSTWRDQAAMGGDTAGLQEATLILVKLLRGRGALDEARELIEEVVAARSANPEIAMLAGELAEAAGDQEGALAAATELLRLAGDETARVAGAERLTAMAERMGCPGEIVGDLEAALASSPGNARLFQLVSQVYETTGETRKLALLLYETASRCEDEAERFRRLGRAGALLVQIGEGSTAVMALNEALTVRTDDQPTILLLSEAYILAGALQDAADLLKPLIAAHKGKASPALAVLWAQVARIAARAGDTKSELQALSRALDADRKNGVVAAQLADRAEAAGDDELVTKALRSITAYQPAGPISVALALLRQARMAHRRGESDRAILFARRAAQEATQDDPILIESREFLKSVGAS